MISLNFEVCLPLKQIVNLKSIPRYATYSLKLCQRRFAYLNRVEIRAFSPSCQCQSESKLTKSRFFVRWVILWPQPGPFFLLSTNPSPFIPLLHPRGVTPLCGLSLRDIKGRRGEGGEFFKGGFAPFDPDNKQPPIQSLN